MGGMRQRRGSTEPSVHIPKEHPAHWIWHHKAFVAAFEGADVVAQPPAEPLAPVVPLRRDGALSRSALPEGPQLELPEPLLGQPGVAEEPVVVDGVPERALDDAERRPEVERESQAVRALEDAVT